MSVHGCLVPVRPFCRSFSTAPPGDGSEEESIVEKGWWRRLVFLGVGEPKDGDRGTVEVEVPRG